MFTRFAATAQGCYCAGFSDAEMLVSPHALPVGVGEAPRHEVAGGGAVLVQRALWGLCCSGWCGEALVPAAGAPRTGLTAPTTGIAEAQRCVGDGSGRPSRAVVVGTKGESARGLCAGC